MEPSILGSARLAETQMDAKPQSSGMLRVPGAALYGLASGAYWTVSLIPKTVSKAISYVSTSKEDKLLGKYAIISAQFKLARQAKSETKLAYNSLLSRSYTETDLNTAESRYTEANREYSRKQRECVLLINKMCKAQINIVEDDPELSEFIRREKNSILVFKQQVNFRDEGAEGFSEIL